MLWCCSPTITLLNKSKSKSFTLFIDRLVMYNNCNYVSFKEQYGYLIKRLTETANSKSKSQKMNTNSVDKIDVSHLHF